jgi:YbbR domain-containing protein
VVKSQLKLIHIYLKKYVFKKGALVFLISLTVSFIFWILLVLDENYTATFGFKIQVDNIPADKILKTPLPENNVIKLEGKGWDLLKLRRSQESLSVPIDLSEIKGSSKVSLNTVKSIINSKDLRNMVVKEVYPENISVVLDNFIHKKIPVNVVLDIHYKKQFGRSGPVIVKPQYLEAGGPESLLNNIDTIHTKKISLYDVEDNINDDVEIADYYLEKLKLDKEFVNLQIEVEALTEASQNVSIKVLPEHQYAIKIIPERLNIKYQVPLSKYKFIDSAYFDVYVDTRLISESNDNNLKVYFKSKSDYIYYPRISTEYVNYFYLE